VRGVVALFQKHWAKLLDVAPGARRVQYGSEELRGRVEEAFAAPAVGWSHARYNSPDVMVAAPSLEAVGRGDYLLVLGELHAASITLTNWLFLAQHESPERLIACKAADQTAPQVILTATKYQPTLTVRTTRALLTEQDYFLESSHEASSAPLERRLPIGELVLERQAGGVVVRTRDGRLQFDVVEFLGHALSSAVMNAVKVFPPSGHTPRLTIDRLVVCREQWTFGPPEMPFAQEADEASRFVAARRWARAHGMPRFVFVKTPAEVKPFYVDFDSHIYVNIFAKMIRRAAAAAAAGAQPRITVSERLPTAEQTFLPDAEGRRYTSELRFVAFEPPR
jgi:hypothetical protein